MVHKSVAALIDEAVLPAVLIVAAKILGVILANFWFAHSWTLESGSFFGVLPSVSYFSLDEFLLVNSISNCLMFATITAGTALVIIRAHFFHASHIPPRLHSRLLRLRLSGLVGDTFKIYHQATIWLIFLWLATVLLIPQAIIGTSWPILAIVAFLVTVNFSWFLAADIQKEVQISKKTRYL